ncbi:Serine protease 56 [Entomophthora muscae]|uniref:Serine protease 56 n=2 Tax=Entomophthora muscae TaxID=34485 RepID=A0ACC2S965_9FUNG|nr:Serine protease 56 [Entomophthora muscae]KAJ9076139.1 Serine protease 56 [Entomophthora muscae]
MQFGILASALLLTLVQAGPKARVVGGYEVEPHFRYNFAVSLQRFKRHFCGGTLYREDTVITASHCTVGLVNFGFEAVSHRHDLGLSDEEEEGSRRRVLNRVRHPGYNETIVKDDIAIWKLESPSKRRTGIILSSGKNTAPIGTVIGWGTTSAGGSVSTKLLEVKIPLYDMTKCSNLYTQMGGYINKTLQICAGYPEGGKDACQGDSGGPFFYQDKQNQRFYLLGVTSWGLGCAQKDRPGIYTRIEAYVPWILETISSSADLPPAP